MKDIEAAARHLRYLDELAAGNSLIHQLHPGVKLGVTLAFIVVVASFSRLAVLPLLPLFCYPMVGLILGELPSGYLIKRMLWAAPLVLMVGLFNPLLERTPVVLYKDWAVAVGWVALLSLLLKFSLTVLVVLILIATTGVNQLGAVLQCWGLPRIWVEQLLFLYRYLFVLLEETGRVIRAYTLRSGAHRGINFAAWGSLVGQLLLRTLERAQRIYQAMLCRGYHGEIRRMRSWRWRLGDGIFLVFCAIFLLLVKLVDLTQVLGEWGWGLFK